MRGLLRYIPVMYYWSPQRVKRLFIVLLVIYAVTAILLLIGVPMP